MTTEEILKLMGLGPTSSDKETEKKFNVYWIALLASKPAIGEREQIILTKENFRKAMLNAFLAGAKST